MKPHEERVLKEYEELNKRVENLIGFTKDDRFDGVSQCQSGLLYAQVHIMMAYRSVLISRLADFGIDVEG